MHPKLRPLSSTPPAHAPESRALLLAAAIASGRSLRLRLRREGAAAEELACEPQAIAGADVIVVVAPGSRRAGERLSIPLHHVEAIGPIDCSSAA